MIKVIDNFLNDKNLEDTIEKELLSSEYPWFYQNATAYESPWRTDDRFNEFGFLSHTMVKDFEANSKWYQIAKAFAILTNKYLNIENEYNTINRAFSNLVFRNGYTKPTPPHVDNEQKHLVLLYYVNDSDGNTIIWDKDIQKIEAEVEPRKGRMLIFEGSHWHSGHAPQHHDIRMNINVNLMFREEEPV
jgi:hypothetical protein